MEGRRREVGSILFHNALVCVPFRNGRNHALIEIGSTLMYTSTSVGMKSEWNITVGAVNITLSIDSIYV